MSELLKVDGNGVTVLVPDGYKELVARRLDLDQDTAMDDDLKANLYADIAEGFTAIGYHAAASAAMRRAEHYARKAGLI